MMKNLKLAIKLLRESNQLDEFVQQLDVTEVVRNYLSKDEYIVAKTLATELSSEEIIRNYNKNWESIIPRLYQCVYQEQKWGAAEFLIGEYYKTLKWTGYHKNESFKKLHDIIDTDKYAYDKPAEHAVAGHTATIDRIAAKFTKLDVSQKKMMAELILEMKIDYCHTYTNLEELKKIVEVEPAAKNFLKKHRIVSRTGSTEIRTAARPDYLDYVNSYKKNSADQHQIIADRVAGLAYNLLKFYKIEDRYVTRSTELTKEELKTDAKFFKEIVLHKFIESMPLYENYQISLNEIIESVEAGNFLKQYFTHTNSLKVGDDILNENDMKLLMLLSDVPNPELSMGLMGSVSYEEYAKTCNIDAVQIPLIKKIVPQIMRESYNDALLEKKILELHSGVAKKAKTLKV